MPLTSLPAPWISPLRESCSPVSESSPSFSTRSPKPLSIPPSPRSKLPSPFFSSFFLIICMYPFNSNSVLLHFGVKGFVVHVERAAADNLPQRQIAPRRVARGRMLRRCLLHDPLACFGPQSEMLLVNNLLSQQHGAANHGAKLAHISRPAIRSEERRVGKECR